MHMSLLAADTNATASVAAKERPLSLEEAIRSALENNLDIKVQRFNPQIAEFNLRGSYAVYEPQLNLTAIHTFNSRKSGSRTSEGIPLPDSEIENDILSGAVLPGVSGIFPTGLGYNFRSSLNHQTFNQGPISDETFAGSWSLDLEQPLLRDFWIDSGRAQILINKKNIKFSEYTLLQQIMLTIFNVEQAYYNLISARDNVNVAQKALELADRTLADNKIKVQVGTLAQLEEKQAESQVATSRADLLAAQRNLALQENLLKGLLTSDYIAWHDIILIPAQPLVAVPVSYDLQESWRQGLAMRPDLQGLRIDLERRDITLRFQKNQILPALDLVGSYGHNGLNTSYGRVVDDLTKNDNPSYSYGVRFNIPLGNIGARNRYKVSKAEKDQAITQYKRLEQDILIEIDDALKLAQTSFQRVEATKQARLFAEAALDAEQKKLESGKGTVYFVLDFQRRLTAARFDEIRALADYNNALAQVSFREGTTLKRHRLDVKLR
jgi:outer membrane protein